ncbi:hypothetical protein AK812_SmicGene34361 [Symbiodinium microadriaticum]|uniref:Uncharacterized protein n=1 Tax=Symbiodinium microadriaticum TaxID=2951 RepID=A0A1Q9CP61_SYMMI|nr:hypothetical protein AK812_SmicGene34361 [Symbiodinium microadriaticum]CAE7569585.1 unnamed protein product [Symbiodinium microadriaticum]
MTAARSSPEATTAAACASPEEDLESVEDDDVTGAEARQKRKQRREAREAARLQRLAQKAAARRSGPSAEELRAQKIAEKAAARRAKARGALKEPSQQGAEEPDTKPMEQGEPLPEEEAAPPTAQNGHSVEGKDGKDKNHREPVNSESRPSKLCAENLAPESEANEKEDKTAEKDAATRKQEDTPKEQAKAEDKKEAKESEAVRDELPHRKRKMREEDTKEERKEGRRSRDRRRRAEDHKRRRSSGSRKGHRRHRRRRDSRDGSLGKGAGTKKKDASRSRSAKKPARRANAISPPKPAKARPAVGARVKVLTENEDKEGLYYDDDRVGSKGMTGRIVEDDTSEQPFRVKLKNGKLSWFKEEWLEELDGGSSSSSSSSSSSDSSGESAEDAAGNAQSPGDEAVAFAWERTPKNLPAAGLAAYALNGAGGVSPLAAEVETFLATAMVDGQAAQRLRCMPAHQQRMVMDRGPIAGSRAPEGVLVARIRDAELGRAGPGAMGAIPMNGGPPSSNPEIEKFISKWSLDVKASWMLRSLPPDKHETVLKMSVEKARNPSAYIISQMNSLFGGVQGIQELQRMNALANGNRDAMLMVPKFNKEPNFNLTAVTI